MAQKLSDYLKSIGQEIHDRGYTDDEGVIRPITKNEMLGREVWKRALGYEEEIANADGSVIHRTFLPDPKAQSFIFERIEGKVVTPTEETSIVLLEKIGEIARNRINAAAEEIVDDLEVDENLQ